MKLFNSFAPNRFAFLGTPSKKLVMPALPQARVGNIFFETRQVLETKKIPPE
jgi:hypothetical protein